MSDFTSLEVGIPARLSDFLDKVRALSLPGFIVQYLPLKSVVEYSLSRPQAFPRPNEHFVFADYLIDNPILTVDLGATSSTYGQVLAYSYGEQWLIADSLRHLLERLKLEREMAVWGIGGR